MKRVQVALRNGQSIETHDDVHSPEGWGGCYLHPSGRVFGCSNADGLHMWPADAVTRFRVEER